MLQSTPKTGTPRDSHQAPGLHEFWHNGPVVKSLRKSGPVSGDHLGTYGI
jgi:hypothetical protein